MAFDNEPPSTESAKDSPKTRMASTMPFLVVYGHLVAFLVIPAWAIAGFYWNGLVLEWQIEGLAAWLARIPVQLSGVVIILAPWLLAEYRLRSATDRLSERLRRIPVVSYLADAADDLQGWRFTLAVPMWMMLVFLIAFLMVVLWALLANWQWVPQAGLGKWLLILYALMTVLVSATDIILYAFGPDRRRDARNNRSR